MPRARVVLDTNVVISALFRFPSVSSAAFSIALMCDHYTTEAILAEYEGVLKRRKFGFADDTVDGIMRNIRQTSKLVKTDQWVNVSPDPTDNKFLECCLAAEADFLITGNAKDFPRTFRQTRIVNPREFLDQYLHL